MRKIIDKMVLVAVLALVVACSQTLKKKLGLTRNSPDEFRVISNAPLTLPPDFTIRPPKTNIEEKQDEVSEKTRETLLQKKVKTSSSKRNSKAETLFLDKAGASDANPQIRQILEQDIHREEKLAQKDNLLDKVNIFKKLGQKTSPKVKGPEDEQEKEDGFWKKLF